MKSRTKKILIAIIFGSIFLNSGFLFAKNYDVHNNNPPTITLSENSESAERKREFWEKFRESVKPREKNPPEKETPEKVRPEKINPEKETHEKAD